MRIMSPPATTLRKPTGAGAESARSTAGSFEPTCAILVIQARIRAVRLWSCRRSSDPVLTAFSFIQRIGPSLIRDNTALLLKAWHDFFAD